jgi:hypothetical protein
MWGTEPELGPWQSNGRYGANARMLLFLRELAGEASVDHGRRPTLYQRLIAAPIDWLNRPAVIAHITSVLGIDYADLTDRQTLASVTAGLIDPGVAHDLPRYTAWDHSERARTVGPALGGFSRPRQPPRRRRTHPGGSGRRPRGSVPDGGRATRDLAGARGDGAGGAHRPADPAALSGRSRHSTHQPHGQPMRERVSLSLHRPVRRARGGPGRSIAITTVAIACLAVLPSCKGEPTAPPVIPPVTPPAQQEIPISGAAVPGMESYDQVISAFMRKHAIPGGAVAVLRDGKLLYARGFGYADVENRTVVQPDALFRIASVSKPITSAADHEARRGRASSRSTIAWRRSSRTSPLHRERPSIRGGSRSPFGSCSTTPGGWDRARPNGGFDPMDRPAIAAAAVNAPAPASAETIIRYMKGMPLDFNPGEKHVYSNFGYAILGRVIERVSGMPYEEYVRAHVLQPVGANRTRSGRTRMRDALADEVKYYLPGRPGLGLTAPMVPSVFPGEGAVPVPTGPSTSRRAMRAAPGSRRPSISCDSWPASMAAPIVRTSSALDSSRR